MCVGGGGGESAEALCVQFYCIKCWGHRQVIYMWRWFGDHQATCVDERSSVERKSVCHSKELEAEYFEALARSALCGVMLKVSQRVCLLACDHGAGQGACTAVSNLSYDSTVLTKGDLGGRRCADETMANCRSGFV